MIYLLTYSRRQGRVIELRKFAADQRQQAEEARLERDLKSDAEVVEVVLLEAQSEQQLRATHSRYFETASELMRAE
jgi:hypothetical protein